MRAGILYARAFEITHGVRTVASVPGLLDRLVLEVSAKDV